MALVVALVGFTTIAAAAGAVEHPRSVATSQWTVYHGDPIGSGVASLVSSVDTSSPRWRSGPLDGSLYGEPLVYAHDVYVATEDDTVYALSSANGHVVWRRHLASPVPSSALPCGDISPEVGITGTPVIDPGRNEVFVVADEFAHGRPEHVLVGLNATSGALEARTDVDPRGADPAALLQRTGLNLDHGRVVFAMGGNYGDCASYRGRVVSVPETGGPPSYFTVDSARGDSQGAVWMGGAAPVVNAAGDLWVSVGNGSVDSAGRPYDDSDSALELSASLRLVQYFAPSTWFSDNASDLDMSMVPALLGDGQVVVAGKSGTAYLLDGAHLGGIGHEEEAASVCGNDIDGASAFIATTLYLPCLNGTVALRVSMSPLALHVLWSSPDGGGPAIVAAGLVWSIGQDGVLYGLSPTTGTVRQHVAIGVGANHFPVASVGDGLLLAPTFNRVVAFSAR